MFVQVQVDEASLDSVNLETIRGEARNQAVNPMAAGRKSAQRLHQHRGYINYKSNAIAM
jgi:hypothetical protein